MPMQTKKVDWTHILMPDNTFPPSGADDLFERGSRMLEAIVLAMEAQGRGGRVACEFDRYDLIVMRLFSMELNGLVSAIHEAKAEEQMDEQNEQADASQEAAEKVEEMIYKSRRMQDTAISDKFPFPNLDAKNRSTKH